MSTNYAHFVGPDFVGLVPGSEHRHCLAWRIRAARRLRSRLRTGRLVSPRRAESLGALIIRLAKSRSF